MKIFFFFSTIGFLLMIGPGSAEAQTRSQTPPGQGVEQPSKFFDGQGSTRVGASSSDVSQAFKDGDCCLGKTNHSPHYKNTNPGAVAESVRLILAGEASKVDSSGTGAIGGKKGN